MTLWTWLTAALIFAGARSAQVEGHTLSSVPQTVVPGRDVIVPELQRAEPVGGPAGWFGADDYPPEAIRAMSQGVVGYILVVNPAGTVATCKVVSGSGSDALDAQTCALLRARARFQPTVSGAPRQYVSRVRWTLPVEATLPSNLPTAPLPITPVEIGLGPMEGTGGAELTVGSDGVVLRCNPLGRMYKNVPAPPEICASYPAGTRYGPPTVHGGRPVRRRVRIRLQIETAAMSGG